MHGVRNRCGSNRRSLLQPINHSYHRWHLLPRSELGIDPTTGAAQVTGMSCCDLLLSISDSQGPYNRTFSDWTRLSDWVGKTMKARQNVLKIFRQTKMKQLHSQIKSRTIHAITHIHSMDNAQIAEEWKKPGLPPRSGAHWKKGDGEGLQERSGPRKNTHQRD